MISELTILWSIKLLLLSEWQYFPKALCWTKKLGNINFWWDMQQVIWQCFIVYFLWCFFTADFNIYASRFLSLNIKLYQYITFMCIDAYIIYLCFFFSFLDLLAITECVLKGLDSDTGSSTTFSSYSLCGIKTTAKIQINWNIAPAKSP